MTSRHAHTSQTRAPVLFPRPKRGLWSRDSPLTTLSQTLSSFSSIGLPIERLGLRQYTETLFSVHLSGGRSLVKWLVTFHFDLATCWALFLPPARPCFGSSGPPPPPPTLLACHQRDGSVAILGNFRFVQNCHFPFIFCLGKLPALPTLICSPARLGPTQGPSLYDVTRS